MRRIILTIDLPDAGQEADRVGQLTQTATDLGFEVAADRVLATATGFRAPFSKGIKDAKTRQHVDASGITELAEFCDLTAYEAWRALGGLPIIPEGGTRVLRARGKALTHVCRMLVIDEIGFADINPRDFKQYSRQAWEALGATPFAASVLEAVEVFDERVLRQLTDEDIDSLHCSPHILPDIFELRDQLRKAA